MTRPLRVAVAGFGLAGRVFHAPFVHARDDLDLAAIVTSSAERGLGVSERYPSVAVVPSVAALEDHAVDLLVVAGPPHTHASHARWALQRDIAVVVDKPFARSVREAEELVELAESRDGRLTVFHNRRWDGDFVGLRELASDPALGDVFEFESSFEHWDPHPRDDWKLTLPVSDGGGVAMDLGSHLVDQALLLLGPAVEVSADLRGVRGGAGNDDVAVIRLTHLSGARSTLRASRLGNQPLPRFRLSGTEGSVVVHGLDPQEALLEAGTPAVDLTETQLGSPRVATVRIGDTLREQTLPAGDYGAFFALLAPWVHGSGPAPVDPREALAVLRTLERATAALR